jgi:hypothetical protein
VHGSPGCLLECDVLAQSTYIWSMDAPDDGGVYTYSRLHPRSLISPQNRTQIFLLQKWHGQDCEHGEGPVKEIFDLCLMYNCGPEFRTMNVIFVSKCTCKVLKCVQGWLRRKHVHVETKCKRPMGDHFLAGK